MKELVYFMMSIMVESVIEAHIRPYHLIFPIFLGY